MRRALQTRLAWVQLPGLSKALNSGDLVFFVHDREGQAGVHSSAVDLDRTRATLAAIVSEADGTRARQSSNRSVHHRTSKIVGQTTPARSMPTTMAFRREYFHDIKSPVQVDITSAKAVAPKNIFNGSGLGVDGAGVGGGYLGESGFGASSFGPSVLGGPKGAVFLGARYRVPFLCNCDRWIKMAGGM